MTFKFQHADAGKLQEYSRRIVGPVYALQHLCAVDDELDIVFLDLGGDGDLAPGRGDCPTYYNLFWRDVVLAFEGYDALRRSDDGITVVFTITSLRVPQQCAQMTQEIKNVLVMASQCYWNGRYKKELLVDVSFPEIEWIASAASVDTISAA